MKELKELALNITEQEYRDLPYMHYSALAKYAKEGFSALERLDEKIESPSLTFGSMVDTLITEGHDAFNEKYHVVSEISSPEGVKLIIQELFNQYKDSYQYLTDIDKNIVIEITRKQEFRNNWKDDTVYKHIIDNGSSYYTLLHLSQNKSLVSADEYSKALKVYDTLKNSKATKYYFKEDDPFDEDVKRYYQLKFKTDLNGYECKAMMDLIIVNYKEKVIIPIDLKTTSINEWDFPKAFINYRYDIQASLYWSILNNILQEDNYFKKFKLLPFRFICINKDNLKPLVWEDDSCTRITTLQYPAKPIRLECAVGLLGQMRDNIGKEYPVGIKEVGINNIAEHLYGKVI